MDAKIEIFDVKMWCLHFGLLTYTGEKGRSLAKVPKWAILLILAF
jgi:hypothetical protein